MAIDRRKADQKPYSLTHIANMGFDAEAQLPVTEVVGFDGVNMQRQGATAMALKITVVGSITYLAKAAPGTDEATALWQCMKIDETSGTRITWADGDASFDNIATDLTALSYL